MVVLSVDEYATLRGCTVRYVQQLCQNKTIIANERFGAGGKNGLSYEIPLASCEPNIIKKYNRLHGIKENKEPKCPYVIPDTLEELSTSERAEVAFWKSILSEWDEFREGSRESKAKLDEKFVVYLNAAYKDRRFSVRMLYRKKKAYMDNGECALADGRGKHDNHKRAISDEVFDVFQYYYLDESRKSVAECIRLTELSLKHSGKDEMLPLASKDAFARLIVKEIPVPVMKYFRFGQKAFKDECAPYIKRTYGDLSSNDIWVCDNHTFDIFIDDGIHKKPIRVYLTGFLDVRSRKMVGWYVTDAPSSDATLQALRRGIEKYGIPKHIYSDNGREFLTHDIGGRGFRKDGRKDGEHQIPTILNQLQIEFHTALVRNARAKIIERAFREVKEMFSRLFEGYTGGTIAERPERLKTLGKKAANFTPYEAFEMYVDTYIAGIFNKQAHGGIGMKGKSRDEVFADCLYEQRVAGKDDLNLMLLRNSRLVTVRRDGVVLKLYDTELTFWSDELLYNHIGEKVYFRYNPDDLKEVRVYDEKDRFICSCEQHTALSYFASKEDVAEKMRKQRQLERVVKAYKKDNDLKGEDALTLIMEEAERNLMDGEQLNPKIVTLIRKIDETEDTELKDIAVGEVLDWNHAIENLLKEKQAKEE